MRGRVPLARPDPRQHALPADPRLVPEPDARAFGRHAAGQDFPRQLLEIAAEFLLGAGIGLRVDRAGRHVPKAQPAHREAHPLDAAIDLEKILDPPPEVGDGPAGRLAGARIGAGLQPFPDRLRLVGVQSRPPPRTRAVFQSVRSFLVVAAHPVAQGLKVDPGALRDLAARLLAGQDPRDRPQSPPMVFAL